MSVGNCDPIIFAHSLCARVPFFRFFHSNIRIRLISSSVCNFHWCWLLFTHTARCSQHKHNRRLMNFMTQRPLAIISLAHLMQGTLPIFYFCCRCYKIMITIFFLPSPVQRAYYYLFIFINMWCVIIYYSGVSRLIDRPAVNWRQNYYYQIQP